MEIFESLSERERGERSLEDVEIRMKKFAEELNKRGLSDDANTFVQDESKVALRRFLKLNILILDLRKVRTGLHSMYSYINKQSLSFNMQTLRQSGRYSRNMKSVQRFQ